MSHRGRVEIGETHQDFADKAGANRPEPIATAPNVGLPLDVVPERPAARAQAPFVETPGRNEAHSSGVTWSAVIAGAFAAAAL